jgi:hypothetical protein
VQNSSDQAAGLRIAQVAGQSLREQLERARVT